MTKRIALLLATVLFAATSFAGPRVEKDSVKSETAKTRETEAKESQLKAEKVEKEISSGLVNKMGGKAKSEAIEAGLKEGFGTDIVKKIYFVSTIDAMIAKGGELANVAQSVRQLLTRLGNGSLNASQKEGIVILLKNLEMAMTEMGEEAVLKFEKQLYYTNVLTYSNKSLTGDQIQELAIINSMKAELNAVLPEGQKLSLEKEYVDYRELTDNQKKEAGKRLAEWKEKCG